LRALRGEHDAGNPRAGEHFCEAFLSGRGFQGYAVQMKLIAVRAQQQAASALPLQHRAQFVPGDFKLRGGARMPELVEAGEL
jgi:hypothetical protein